MFLFKRVSLPSSGSMAALLFTIKLPIFILYLAYSLYKERRINMYVKKDNTFDQFKDYIGYRLINRKNHEAQLQLCPHKAFLDLAKVYVLKLTEEPTQHHLSKVSGKIVFGPEFEANEMDIDNSMLKTWHIALEELDKIAEKNISRLAPSFLCKNVDLLSAMGLDIEKNSPFTEYILTNIDAWDGAATMLYTDDIAKLAEKKESDVYVKEATEIQLRLPTSMGLFLLPLFSFFLPRKYHKI